MFKDGKQTVSMWRPCDHTEETLKERMDRHGSRMESRGFPDGFAFLNSVVAVEYQKNLTWTKGASTLKT